MQAPTLFSSPFERSFRIKMQRAAPNCFCKNNKKRAGQQIEVNWVQSKPADERKKKFEAIAHKKSSSCEMFSFVVSRWVTQFDSEIPVKRYCKQWRWVKRNKNLKSTFLGHSLAHPTHDRFSGTAKNFATLEKQSSRQTAKLSLIARKCFRLCSTVLFCVFAAKIYGFEAKIHNCTIRG